MHHLGPDMTATLAFGLLPGHWEWLIILLIGLLIFGRRLPEVGRNIGKTVVEFRKGISDIEREVDSEVKRDQNKLREPERAEPSVQTESRAVAQDAPSAKPSEA